MKWIRLTLLSVTAVLAAVSLAITKPEYAKKEGKACTYCHPGGKFKESTEAGKYYKEHHSLEGFKGAAQKN